MISRFPRFHRVFGVFTLLVIWIVAIEAQTTRPRRTGKSTKTTSTTDKSGSDPLLKPQPEPSPTARRTDSNAPLLDVQPVKPVANTVAPADTKHAYLLLEQKQFAAAAKEAKDLAAQHPNDPEAWKIAGFAELNLKQYNEAAKDLEKAVDLQHKTNQADPNTESALGQAYVLGEKYQEALPLLTAATRSGSQSDALMIYYRGI